MTKETEEVFKALGNGIRLKIVRMLLPGELSCQDLRQQFELSQPTMSHHFSTLIDHGIIKVRKNGTQHYYSLNQTLLNRHGIFLKKQVTSNQ